MMYATIQWIMLYATFLLTNPQTDKFMMTEANIISNITCTLGEGPIWHPLEKVYYWVDIIGQQLYRYDPASHSELSFQMGSMIGTAVPVCGGGVLVALETGVFYFNGTENMTKLADYPDDAAPNTRFNDGKCDPAGRLWVGTMEKEAKPHQGKLYRLDDLVLTPVLDNVTISNGLAWSIDKKTMYYIDTFEQTIYAFDYNNKNGEISGRKAIVEIPLSMGSPDGMTIDSEGKLWVALWGGYSVVRFDPETGRQMDKIEIPAPNVTSCTFGGHDLHELFCTTAREGLEKEKLKQYPHSGKPFSMKSPYKGIDPYCFIIK